MLPTRLGLCFLICCWAVAGADKCDINANGTSTCAGSDQTTLLQSRVQVSIDNTDSLSSEALTEHVYGPFKHDKSVLDYFKHLHQNAIDARLAKIIPDDVDDDELQVIFSNDSVEESFLEADSDLESDIQALSAVSASELLQAEIEDECPHQAASLIAHSDQMEYEVVHAETADKQGVRHTLLKGKDGQLQYIASRSVQGEHRTLIADPPACSAGPLATFQTKGVPAPTGVISADDPVDPEMSRLTRQTGGEAHLLALDDQLVADCLTLLKRTVAEGCNNKQLDVQVLRAERRIIDGIDVKMNVQVCKPGTQECHPHRPECAFETSADHTDAKLLQFPQSSQTVPPRIQAEQDGLQATLKLHCPLCDVDARNGTTLAETEDNALLMEYQMGENSRYKGFEHVYDNYPDWSALDLGLDTLPTDVDFRKKYPKCYPALPSGSAGSETVRNQGTCGSCWAFASATTTMTNLCISGDSKNAMFTTTDRLEVSVQKVLSCAGSGQGCNGGNMGGFDTAASKWGLTKERDNLYKCGGGDPKKHFASKSDCSRFPWGGSCVGNANPDWWWRGGARLDGERKMQEVLAKGLALYVTMDVYRNFFSLRGGIYSALGGGKMGGHAMSALGYGAGPEKDSSGKLIPYWIIQNSWGTRSWGVQGIGRIIRGTNIAGLEERAMTAAAWVTGGTQPPCEDSTSGSGLSRDGRPPFIACSSSTIKRWYCGRSSVMASCPKTCGQCAGFNGAGTKPGPQPTPAPKPPTPPGQRKCCRGSCSSSSDCGNNLFCCPGHKMCMDRTTKSTAGPNCNICKNGGRPAPRPSPSPTPSPSGPTKPPSANAKTCDFEESGGTSAKPYCGLWKNVGGDKIDWKRAYKTPSRGTGPDKAKTGRYFLFIETSGRMRSGDNAILETTTGVLASSASLNFAYSMNGRSIGALKVKADGKKLFEEKGNKGKAWKIASVNLGAFAGSQVKLQIEASRGWSWSGDIAIDDVTLDVGLSATAPPTTTTLAPTTAAPASAPTTTPKPASSVFDRIDLDKNNGLSRDEWNKAIDSGVFTPNSK